MIQFSGLGIPSVCLYLGFYLASIWNSDIHTDVIPACNLPPICSSDIITDFIPFWTVCPTSNSD